MTGHLFARISNSKPLPVADHGDGPYIVARGGKRYLDASGGAAVSCLGHSDESIKDAIRAQLDQLAYAHTGFFTTDAAERLADKLVELAPPGIDRVYLVSGGSEANEAALKLVRQYYLEIGQPGRRHVIARRQSYHGNTLGALAAGGNMARRAQFAPLLMDTTHIAPCYAYRDKADGETPEEYGMRVAGELEEAILRLGPETVMAFIAEPVVGATAGAVPPVPGYFARIREICDTHGVLLILDEVMCGMGRTGTLFACEQEGIAPDIVTVAKGLGAGYQPVGAALCTAQIHDAIADGSGSFQHGHTYIGHPMAAAASLAVLEAIQSRDLLGNVRTMGDTLRSALEARFGQHPNVGDIRGRGLFLGMEFVADRQSRTPFDPARKLAARLKSAAMDEGLICYPMSGTIDGKLGDHVLLAPPFIIGESHVGELTDKLSAALDKALT